MPPSHHTAKLIVPFPEEGNVLYPLPPDYERLDTRGKRLARVNACKQWVPWWYNGDRHKMAKAFVASFRFFIDYYLKPSGEYDPNFFSNTVFNTPAFHYRITHEHMLHPFFAFVAPRGSAKSYLLSIIMALKMLSHPGHSIVYTTSVKSLGDRLGERLRYFFYTNARVYDDWKDTPDFGGRIQPKRSEGVQGMDNFRLGNRAELYISSSEARQRGLRPTDYIIDDAEYDPSGSTSMADLRDWMEELIFKIITPMIAGPGQSILLAGTFVSTRHYLWHIMQTEAITLADGTPSYRAIDPRFDFWRRLVFSIAEPVNGKLTSLWPEKWPVDEAERNRLGLHSSTLTIPQVELLVKTDIFNAEYRCRPDLSQHHHFPALTRELHGYWLNAKDDLPPPFSQTTIHWMRNEKEISYTLAEFCKLFHRFIIIDTSFTNNAHSDYKAAQCLALTDHNELFSLDLWCQKSAQGSLVEASLQMAERWRATLHPEVTRQGRSLYEELQEIVRNRSQDIYNVQWLPTAIVPLPSVMSDKTSRIDAALYRRLQHGLVKLPWALRLDSPWRMLYDQIASFNPQLRDGGLQHDDAIDTLAMHTLVATRASSPRNGPEPLTFLQRLVTNPTSAHPEDILVDPRALTLTPFEIQKIAADRAKALKDSADSAPSHEDSIV